MACHHYSYPQWVAILSRYPFRDPHMAAAIVMAESQGSTCAKNVNDDGSIDRGAFQINSVHGSLSTFKLHDNIAAAGKISGWGRDWSAWVTYQTGAFKSFLRPGTKPQAVATGPGARAPGASLNGSGADAAAVDSPEHRSSLLKALMWVLFVLGGAGLALFGSARMFGIKRPPVSAAGAAKAALK